MQWPERGRVAPKRRLADFAFQDDSSCMTFLWILCVWTVGGLPLGMLVGAIIARADGERSQPAEMPLMSDLSVCS
jgi:hypothetical protein